MTQTEVEQVVEELRGILGNLKDMKPEQIRQHIFAQNFGQAATKAEQITTTVKDAMRQLDNLSKSLPQTNEDFR
jgi:polyribonucleotide nucleotidyltransferase